MELSSYDFLIFFVVVPLLLFRLTLIPEWFYRRIRRLHVVYRYLLFALLLILGTVLVVALSNQGLSIRVMALTIAVLVCVVHYTYGKSALTDDKEDE